MMGVARPRVSVRPREEVSTRPLKAFHGRKSVMHTNALPLIPRPSNEAPANSLCIEKIASGCGDTEAARSLIHRARTRFSETSVEADFSFLRRPPLKDRVHSSDALVSRASYTWNRYVPNYPKSGLPMVTLVVLVWTPTVKSTIEESLMGSSICSVRTLIAVTKLSSSSRQ
jgi:hypothetical protein